MAQRPFAVVPEPFTVTSVPTGSATFPEHLAEFGHIGMVARITPAATEGGRVTVTGSFGGERLIDFMSVIQAAVPAGATYEVTLRRSSSTVHSSGVQPFINPARTRSDGLYSSHYEMAAPVLADSFTLTLRALGTSPLDVAKLVLGQRVQTSTFYNPGWEFGTDDRGSLDVGRWGVPEVTPGLILRTMSFRLGWLSEAEFEDRFRPLMERLGKRRVALWCFDPEATAYRQARTYLGWLRENPVAVGGQVPGRYELDLQVLSTI